MVEIFKNSEYKILQDNLKPTLYSIEFNESSCELINSIKETKQLNSFTTTSDHMYFTFKATSVKTFNKFLSDVYSVRGSKKLKYNCILKIIYGLSKQLQYLIQNKKAFYIYTLNNIFVIDDNKFIYLSNDHLMSINTNDQITFYYPFDQNLDFLSPELMKMKELPSNVHYKNIYYSLGCLIIFCIKGDLEFVLDEKYGDKTIDELLESELEEIKGTKIYYFLQRCLIKQPIKRCLILI